MKILGIGNAIVIFCKVDYEFISKNNLTKGDKLIFDENELDALKTEDEKTVSGGLLQIQ